ncbi:hypothetical protein MBLNU459_g0005t3 [Dothideomycetes sp. NU459]
MASSRHSGHNDDDDDFHSLSHHEPEHDGDDELDSVASDDLPPVHPVPALQHAFEESIVDATEDALNDRPAATLLNRPTAESRRQDLLERDHYDYSWNSRWKQKPSASFHPLLKLMAQIIFGMHLLQNHQAKSDAEVVKILQAHVDEIDAFLEKTTEDFDLATKDIEERITFLRLPMTHIEVFDIMLDDKKFRTQLVEGNDKIEQIIERTAKAMNAAKYDVDKGITAVQELAKYLDGVQINWPQDDVDQAAIFVAMRGNEEGWLGCLHELQMKANSLGVALVQLGTVIGEMSKLAAVASRRNKTQGHNRNSMHEAMAVPRSKPNHLPARPPRMTLSELRNLPSLNFSRMDLIDKLNEALEVRSSKSAEIVTRRALPGIFCPSPVRPSSTEALIERYTSFFSKPEDSDIHESMSYDSSVNELQTSEEGDVCNTIHNLGGEDASQAGCSLSPSVRPLSPEELLGIVSDANRLSVPSVTALTERLSEILPSLKRLHIDSAIADDKAIKDTISEIHRLGERFSKVERARSISLIRQKTPVSEEITYGGILRPTLSETKNNRSMKDLPSLPEGTERLDVTGALSLSESGLDKNTTLGTDHQPALATNNMPGMPRPALLRIRSLNDIDGFKDIHLGYTDSAHRRSLATLTQDSRPWNLDENYPWSANGPTIDIVFPAPVLRRNSSASTVLRGASKTSGEMMADETDEASSMAHRKSPLSRTSPLIGFDEHTGTTISTLYGRKASKTSLIGSLSRRIGLKQAKFATLSSPLSQHAVPHRTGERYPSSGLFAPTAIQLDEVRSFFSDSTAENEDKRRPLHKHITSIRSRMPGQAATSTSRLQSLEMDRSKRLHPIHSQLSMRVRTNSSRPASLFDDRVIEMDTPILYDGIVGMGRVEFRVKRVAERLKHFWVKGGEILRSLSQRGRHSGDVNMKQKQRQERQNWLADSLYSSDSAQRLGAR